MDFAHSPERQLLSDSLTRYLAENCQLESRTDVAYEAPFHSPEHWANLCELGVPAAFVSEAHGGFGGSGFDITTVFEALGRGLSTEPFLGQLMALQLAPSDALINGSTKAALAVSELDAPYDLSDIATRIEGQTVTGRKSVVYGGNSADQIFVAGRIDAGLGVIWVNASDAEVAPYGLIDGGGAAEVLLDKTPGTPLTAEAEAALERALDAGRLALCAEAVGIMDELAARTLDYFKTRKQFGREIGSFQALQHRLVDVTIEIEQARSITIAAADAFGSDRGASMIAKAKNLIGRAGKLVAEEAIQMHGGIAMTWEFPVSHYAKRLIMIDAQLGDADWQLERVVALG